MRRISRVREKGAPKGAPWGSAKTAFDMSIPSCFFIKKGKGLLSYENKPFCLPMVEISGIEPLTS